jgi:hypothetical protein
LTVSSASFITLSIAFAWSIMDFNNCDKLYENDLPLCRDAFWCPEKYDGRAHASGVLDNK